MRRQPNYSSRALSANMEQFTSIALTRRPRPYASRSKNFPAPVLMGTTLEVNEERYGGQQIQELYDSTAYTLTRPQSK